MTVFVAEFRDLGEEVFILFLLDLEFAIFDVEFEDSVDVAWLELWNQLVLSVLCDEWDIAVLTSEQFEHLLNLLFDFMDLGCEALVLRRVKSVNDDVENPFCLSLELSVSGGETAVEFDL